MILCITEKPSVAATIAAILGANERHQGYFEGSGYRITWTYGHLCTLLPPEDYSPAWKTWALGTLPMLPEKYDIKLLDDEGYKKQFHVIKHLISEADEIINCGDAGQEGELIQRWVMKLAGTRCPVKRLWISSLTDDAIKEGFSKLQPQQDFDRLFYAGLSRSIGDWILGMNATRLYTLKYGVKRQVLSIGRVQTPTLALIVKRQKEIENFVPKDSWELHTVYRDVDFTSTGERFETEEAGNEAVERIKDEIFKIKSVTKKQGRESAPRLFDLTSLQVECNKRWGWTAEHTLQLIQGLYEKKLTTYPRVDTTYLSEDIHQKVPKVLQQMTPYAKFTQEILARPIAKSKKVFDNSKVTDHHAIIPTGVYPSGIDGDEKKLYHLIALRFIGVFYPDCKFEGTTVLGEAGKEEFKTTGKVILEPGWRVLFPDKNSGDEDASADKTLPVFIEGESGPHVPSLAKKTSQPPKYYTDGTLLRAMEAAGKTIDSEELREALKENGIGRPSTRAAILDTLIKRRYIVRQRKNLMATQAGIDLIAIIQEELLKSAKLTGLWENKLRRIERGDYSPALFIREISDMVRVIVRNVLADTSNMKIGMPAEETKKKADKPEAAKKPRAPRIKDIAQISCPECGKGHLVKGRTAFGCSCYAEGCGFRLSFEKCPPETAPSKIAKMIKK